MASQRKRDYKQSEKKKKKNHVKDRRRNIEKRSGQYRFKKRKLQEAIILKDACSKL
jgi:hypothetical protein